MEPLNSESSDPQSSGEEPHQEKPIEEIETAVIRFAGDSGDGMQLAGSQFTNVSAVAGNDVSTFPDFPADIRAPAGTLGGVSGYQICISSRDIHTPGDQVDTLVAMNPAALKVNLPDLRPGGLIIADSDTYQPSELAKAGFKSNPLEDGSLKGYQLIKVPITTMTRRAVEDVGLSVREADRCRNFFALGLICWLYDRPLEPTMRWIEQKFAKRPEVVEANKRALQAGYNWGITSEAIAHHYRVPRAPIKPGKYKKITGNEAVALGLLTAAKRANKTLVYASYPITPASEILHELSALRHFRVLAIQLEDEIAAMGAAIGAAFGGAIAATGTSGPGLSLKCEAIGLAVMLELPVVIVDVQRAGPSTGLPTKPEQGDLLQALFGRHGEAALPVLAAASPADCFSIVQEAVQIAVKYMTPVIVLSDGYLAFGSEPWRIPEPDELPPIEITHPGPPADGEGPFLPYTRNEWLARPWALPGTPGLEHRIGGLEKEHLTGVVTYDPLNHQRMVELRTEKINRVVADVPDVQINGDPEGELLVVGWGSTYGAITQAVDEARRRGLQVSAVHLRYLHPLPRNLGEVLSRFEKILVPEMNLGQLELLLRARYRVDPIGLHKVQGRPFLVREIYDKIAELLGAGKATATASAATGS